MSDLRIVIDTNATVSAAILRQSVSRRAFDLALSIGTALASESTSLELGEVLHRPKFDKYVSEELRAEFIASYLNGIEFIAIDETIHACRDAGDDKFLEVAINGNASIIISGDVDLLAMNPFRGVEILTPSAFLVRFSPAIS